MNQKKKEANQIIIYTTEDGNAKFEVRFDNETAWLTQKQMADLFDCSVENIIFHLQNILESGELNEKATTKESLVVQKEGNRSVKRLVKLYNLDAIISIGYRINSLRGTQFRIWATQRLREYIIKGFVLDDERMKQGGDRARYSEKKILTNAGRISAKTAEEKAGKEFEKYRKSRDKRFVSDFDQEVKKLLSKKMQK